jgi:very-short-patch-repair endonuclease
MADDGAEHVRRLRRRARDGLLLARDLDPEEARVIRRDPAWQRLRRGAYLAPSEGGAAPAHVERRRLALARIRAVHVELRSPVWFSHTSAALLHGCDLVTASDQVHLVQRSRPHTHGDARVVRHHGEVQEVDRSEIAGIPVTGLARTVVDCAGLLPREDGLVVADSALRLGADRARVEELLAERAGRRGVARARDVLALADGRAESPGETLTRWHLHRHGVERPELQVPVVTPLGAFRADLGWPEARLLLEFDGYVKYSGGGARAAADTVFAEKRRQDALEEAGWRVLRATWPDLRAPATLARRVRTALEFARRRARSS